MPVVMVVLAVGLIAVAKESLAAEPILVIDVDPNGDIVDVRSKDVSLTQKELSMPVDVEGLRLIAGQSLLFAEVLRIDDSLAWCLQCQGRWCPIWLEELRYSIGEAGVTRIQGRVADNWVDLRLGPPSEYGGEEQSEALGKIQSLKSHAIAVLEDEDGERHGLVISGMTISAGEGGPAPSMWLDPKVFGGTTE